MCMSHCPWSCAIEVSCSENPGIAMSHVLTVLRERIRGKSRVKEICDYVFTEYAGTDDLIPWENLHVAVLRVYNYLKRNLLGPHKEPPSKAAIDGTKDKLKIKKPGMGKEEFSDLILEWTNTDLRGHMAHKVILSLLAAPSLALVTKEVGKRVPKIGSVIEKIPPPALFSLYSVALVLAQR